MKRISLKEMEKAAEMVDNEPSVRSLCAAISIIRGDLDTESGRNRAANAAYCYHAKQFPEACDIFRSLLDSETAKLKRIERFPGKIPDSMPVDANDRQPLRVRLLTGIVRCLRSETGT